MKTTPNSYFELFVQPNYRDFLDSRDDARLGFNASVPAYQLADVFYFYHERKDQAALSELWPTKKAFLAELSEREPKFKTVQSVVAVYKHLYAADNGHYEVGSPGAIWGLSFPDFDTALQSEWRGVQGDVLVRKRDGKESSLSDALEAVVVRMWPEILRLLPS